MDSLPDHEREPLVPKTSKVDSSAWRVGAACLGFLADSYDLFTIDLVILILQVEKGTDAIGPSDKSMMVSMMLAGVVTVRATCHGLSAASGKVGALVGTALLSPAEAAFGMGPVYFACAILAISAACATYLFTPRHSVQLSQLEGSVECAVKAQRKQVVAWSLSEKECAPVENIFLEMDAKHEGRITLNELRQELPEDEVDDAELREIWDALVADHDRDQEIHYSDFLAAMLDTRIQLTDDLLHYAFERFDVTHTGHISVQNIFEVLGEYFEGQRVMSLVKEAGLSDHGTFSYKEFEAYMRGSKLLCESHQESRIVQPCCVLQ
ncbi:unnamed protein product [Prorocentrum cordatum]|uniref:EF-hand domain-containing protein n=1 Tax=Prorocentrum cordatum TaxID=2364126 RepID=A0ABN9VAU9_9DINO|nr:unnamed protein product [Polarella glacialis]